jgi:hypothetical protein
MLRSKWQVKRPTVGKTGVIMIRNIAQRDATRKWHEECGGAMVKNESRYMNGMLVTIMPVVEGEQSPPPSQSQM